MVRSAVEAALARQPGLPVVVSGHSLGGALAALCAFDLLSSSPRARSAGVRLVTFAAPRMFNQAFQAAMSRLGDCGALHALRVVVGGDMIARVPPKHLGSVHGILPRLLLNPDDSLNPISFHADDPDDEDLWKIAPTDVHICHALYLGAEVTPGDELTVPAGVTWPLGYSSPSSDM